MDKILDELKLAGNEGYQKIGADYLIIGSVTEFGRKNVGDVNAFSRSKTQTVEAGVSIRLVDVSTGQIIYSEEAKGEAETTNKTVMGLGERTDYDATLSDKAISAAISKLVENIINNCMPGAYWKENQIKALIDKFPEGQVVIKVNNQLAGCALSIIVDYDNLDNNHTYKDITGNYTFSTHTNDGDVLYGIDVFIKPDFRGLRLGRRLYDYRKELCERLNLRGIAFGGRIPNYHKFANELTPKQYIEKVKRQEIHVPYKPSA